MLEGSLNGSSGPAALFIDSGGYNYWHAPVHHGAWYAGARANNNPDLYYNANSIDCTSPRAQSEGYCSPAVQGQGGPGDWAVTHFRPAFEKWLVTLGRHQIGCQR